jgi:NhaP-type Na+/H+ or K+/H+ antiporter
MHADSALLTVASATAAGLLAQLLGHRWRLPAIVPLLAFGVLFGPSVLGLVQPEALGTGLPVIVKLAVAVILFDGALNLRLGDLRRAMHEVRNLVTIGVLVTWVGATLAAHFLARLSWPVAIIFGALMTVTGPTVVQPLLKRVSLPRRVKTALEGEAILIDPVGAVLAVAVLDILLGMAGARPIGVLSGVWAYFGRLIVGLVIGVVAAVVLSRLLKRPHAVPGELANLVVLAGVWTAFGVAEWLHSESGIMAAVAMGLAFQREAVPEAQRLRRFKEQLTVLGISLLFVLLAASLPLEVLLSEGWPGVLTVVALMLVVRPVNAVVSLRRSALSWREKLFIAWVAPRGVVAASVASLFALELREAGFTEGSRLLAITFLTIALTVTVQGLTAGPLARLLKLQSLEGRRAIVVGAGALGRAIADLFRRYTRPVVLVDRNSALVEQARVAGFEAIEGNGLDEETLERAGAEEAETLVAATTNSEVNALAAHLARDAFGVARAYPVLGHPSRGAGPRLVDRVGGRMAFGHPVDVREWEHALEHGEAHLLTYLVPLDWGGYPLRSIAVPDEVIVLARARGGSLEIAHPDLVWQRDDEAIVLGRGPADAAAAALDAVVPGRAQHGVAP